MLEDPRQQAVRAAGRLADGRERRRTGLFLAEGPQAVREALSHRPESVRRLYATPPALASHPDLRDLAERGHVEIVEANDRVIAALADTVTPQGVVAVCRQSPRRAADLFTREARLIVILHEVRDPGNAGTIVRVADAAGADAVVFTAHSVDPYNPKAVRAGTGSLFHLPIAVGTHLDDLNALAAETGMQIIAADIKGENLLDARKNGDLARPTAWLFGNEAHGLTDAQLARADRVLRVPVYGRAESMNLATAAAVCLYESAFALHGGH